jgi:hypothetical protein
MGVTPTRPGRRLHMDSWKEDRGLTALTLFSEPFHLILKFVDALFEEVLMAHLIVPLLKIRRGLEAGEKVLGLRNGGATPQVVPCRHKLGCIP